MSRSYRRLSVQLLILVIALSLVAPLTATYILGRVRRVTESFNLLAGHTYDITRILSALTIRQNELSFWISEIPENDFRGTAQQHEITNRHWRQELESQKEQIGQLEVMLDVFRKDPAHQAYHEPLQNAFRDCVQLRERFNRFIGAAADVWTAPVPAKEDSSQLKELFKQSKDTEENIVRINTQIASVGSQDLENLAHEESHEIMEVGAMISVTFLLCVLLGIKINSLQKQAVQSEKLALLGATAVTLHHEINNPLSVIVGTIYLLQSGKISPAEQSSNLSLISEMAGQIAQVVKRIGALEEISTTEYLRGEKMLDISDDR